jgi:hypothetical protein
MYFKALGCFVHPKSLGDLGFRRSQDMNKAILAKLGWCIVNEEEKLLVQYLKAKYLRGKSFWEV